MAKFGEFVGTEGQVRCPSRKGREVRKELIGIWEGRYSYVGSRVKIGCGRLRGKGTRDKPVPLNERPRQEMRLPGSFNCRGD